MISRNHLFRISVKEFVLIGLLLLAAPGKAQGQATLDWIGPNGTLYNNALNWSPNSIPGTLDTAQFNQMIVHTVIFNQNTQAGRLAVVDDGVTLNLSGFTLDLLDTSDPEGSILVGDGGTGGLLAITNGTMTGSIMYAGGGAMGVINVLAGADVQVDAFSVGQWSPGVLNVTNGGRLTNVDYGAVGTDDYDGTVLVSDSGSLVEAQLGIAVYAGQLTIAGGGQVQCGSFCFLGSSGVGFEFPTVMVTGTDSLLRSGELFIGSSTWGGNQGTLWVEAGGTATFLVELRLDETGTVVIEDAGVINTNRYVPDGGTLDLRAGGTFNLTDPDNIVVIGPEGPFGSQLTLGLGVTPELITTAGIVYVEPNGEVELHADSLKPRRLDNDGTVSILGGNVVMGDPSHLSVYYGDGRLMLDNATLTIDSYNSAVLGFFTLVNNSNLIATGGLLIPGGNTLFSFASADVDARIRADVASLILLYPSIHEMGDPLAYDGFFSDGELQLLDGTLTLHDRDWAVLGSLTQLGDNAGGTLHAPNGLLLELGKTLFGFGSVTADILHHGHIDGVGPMPADALSLTGSVSGPGTFAGNITFAASYAPGSSPAAIDLENATMTVASTLHIELGGLTPGFQHDQLNATGTVDLQGGTLNVTYINGFVPAIGDTFDIINATTMLGSFGIETLPGGLVVHYEPDRMWLEMTSECASDADLDGLVGITDFLGILANWGPCGGGACSAFDSNDDGLVGITDFLAVLANWGACP